MANYSRKLTNQVLDVYECAKEITLNCGYMENIQHLKHLMEKKPYKTIGIKDFVREYLWVVFTCGFKADTVKKHWNQIKQMCCDFDISETNKYTFEELLELSPIKNKKKVKAIKQSCEIIDDSFIEKIHNLQNAEQAKEFFKTLPFIGEVTIYHIMRNMGIDCFKPDRHIVHIKEELGISGEELFDIIVSECKEEYIGVIDHILWRASATIHNVNPNASLVSVALGRDTLNDLPKQISDEDKFLF